MKKTTVTAVFSAVLLIILPAICRIALSGCSEAPPASSDTDQIITDSPEIITDNPVVTTDSPETITYNPEQSDNAPSDSGKDTSDPVSDAVDDSQDEQYTYNPDRDNLSCTDADAYSTEETGTGTESEAGVDSGDDPKVPEDFFGVVWIGDSLTQGSLGDNNFNKNNPQAPWRVLGDISGWKVWGVGFYGYNTSDILWAYTEYDGLTDPGYIYVFWVGSNDFRESPGNVDSVIEQTDRFISVHEIDKYLILGTTNRGDMDPDAYVGINSRLSNRYGDRYLDIMPCVEYEYDGVHLTVDSYKKVAEAVYRKLKQLYVK